MSDAALQEEIDRNFEAFQRLVPALADAQAGRFALMRDCKIIEFFDTARDAFAAGNRLYSEDRLFSVQEVDMAAIDLGFHSHAMS